MWGIYCICTLALTVAGLAEVGRRNGIENQELVLRSTYQIFEWNRNNSDRNFYNVVRYVHIPLVP